MQWKFNGNQNCLITNILQEIFKRSQESQSYRFVNNVFGWTIPFINKLHTSSMPVGDSVKVQDYWDEEEPGKNKNNT